MIGEQTATCRYKTGLQDADIEIQMTVQVERPPELYSDVEIEMRFEPIFPEELEDALYQHLRNGVHGGYALSNVPVIPNTTLAVRILDLRVSPSPQSIQNANDKINLCYLLEMTIRGIVNTLLRSMENLRTGTETYSEG
jgi:hypothetical protein